MERSRWVQDILGDGAVFPSDKLSVGVNQKEMPRIQLVQRLNTWTLMPNHLSLDPSPTISKLCNLG